MSDEGIGVNEESMQERLSKINEAYREEGLFARFGKIARGISKPHASGEYKEARNEVQRLAAPFIAIVVPVVFIIVLCVVTEVTGRAKTRIDVEIAHAQEAENELEEQQAEQDMEMTEDTEVEFSVDTDVPMEVEVNTPTLTPDNTLRQPDPTSVSAVKSPIQMKSVYGETRSSSARADAMKRYGGDPRTERAVIEALRWLATQQKPDGSWEGWTGADRDPYRMQVTGLVLLTFLAHGEKSGGAGEFGDTVSRGLEYLIEHSDNLDPMGTHALAEAYGFLRNPNLKAGATKAVKVLADNLAATEWGDTYASAANYKKVKPSLLKMVYQTMALRSARLSGIEPKNLDTAFARLKEGFLIQGDEKNGGFTSDHYGKPHPGRERLTASWQSIVGVVGMQYLGQGDLPIVEKTLRILDDDWEPPTLGCIDTSCCPVRGNYWSTMVFFNGGGKRWVNWNRQMIDCYYNGRTVKEASYTDKQGVQRDMCYWTCEDMHIGTQPITTTCWVAQQLMVYYRYLPTSSKSAWTKVEAPKEEVAEPEAEVDVEVDI